MRKFIAIISILSFSFASLGYHLAFYLQLHQLKGEMKRSIRSKRNQKQVVEFSFTYEEAAALTWEDQEEFEYRGDMYDVIEKSTAKEKVVIRCIADKKENDLLAAYQKDNERNRPTGKWSLLKLATSDFTASKFEMPAAPRKEITRQFQSYLANTVFQPASIIMPPLKKC